MKIPAIVVTTVPRMKKRTEADVNIAKAAGSIIGALIIAESTADETAGVIVANAISTKIRPRISRTVPANITEYRKIRTNQLPKVLNAVFAYSMEFWMFSLKPITIILTYQSFRLYMSSLTGLKKSVYFFGTGHVCAAQLGKPEIGAGKIGFPHIRTFQMGVGKVSPKEVYMPEIGAFQMSV